MTAVDRRSVLLAGGLLTARKMMRDVALPHRVVFGVNSTHWSAVTAALPLLGAVRIYYDVENEIPAEWPRHYPGLATMSLRPHPADLLTGKLDTALKSLIRSAPLHSELTFWHENTSGNPLHYPSYVNNPRTAIAIQQYGHQLCAGTHVGFGVITCGPAAQQDERIAPRLDWYADDLYDFPRLRNPDGTLSRAKMRRRLDQNLALWRAKSGREWPAIRICETNSPFDSHRENWFTWLAEWMASNNGHRILMYWNAAHGLRRGGLSGPWPPSPGVVQRLRALTMQYHT